MRKRCYTDVKRWVTTSQMGWALTWENNEVTNEREGKPVARQIAPMISKFIRAQWESEELEGVDDKRRQILEESAELDHVWGVWEAEEEPTNVPGRGIKQSSRRREDMRHHVEVHEKEERVKTPSLQEPGSGQFQCTSWRNFAPFTTSTFTDIHASARAWGTAGDRQWVRDT